MRATSRPACKSSARRTRKRRPQPLRLPLPPASSSRLHRGRAWLKSRVAVALLQLPLPLLEKHLGIGRMGTGGAEEKPRLRHQALPLGKRPALLQMLLAPPPLQANMSLGTCETSSELAIEGFYRGTSRQGWCFGVET